MNNNYYLRPYWLFLDDERGVSSVTWVNLPCFAWTIIRNYEDFVKIIKERGLPEFITFDHDLGCESNSYDEIAIRNMLNGNQIDYSKLTRKTGYHCAKWLCDYCIDNKLKLPEYIVHSMNGIGKENIISLLENFKRTQ